MHTVARAINALWGRLRPNFRLSISGKKGIASQCIRVQGTVRLDGTRTTGKLKVTDTSEVDLMGTFSAQGTIRVSCARLELSVLIGFLILYGHHVSYRFIFGF